MKVIPLTQKPVYYNTAAVELGNQMAGETSPKETESGGTMAGLGDCRPEGACGKKNSWFGPSIRVRPTNRQTHGVVTSYGHATTCNRLIKLSYFGIDGSRPAKFVEGAAPHAAQAGVTRSTRPFKLVQLVK